MIRVWLEATRPQTLSAAACPVLVGSSLAYVEGLFNWVPALLCLAFALLVQIGTNFANDYLDGIKGTDTADRIGPRRAVASGLIGADQMKVATLFILAVAFCLGLLLIPYGGWWLLAVGITSVLCAWLYTGGSYPLAYNGLGDVFVIIFFGFVAVGCTYYVQAQSLSFYALLLGLACGLIINNILIVNNYRDYEGDKRAGKRTLVVLLGRHFARRQYIFSTVLVIIITVYCSVSVFGWDTAISVVPLGLSLFVGYRLTPSLSPQEFLAALKISGLVVALYGVLLSLFIVL
ncbi:MAG: 1,4-dihydroxy-2-naphthoate polyprenyltransferase [Verrucomicrobiota bacterium]